MQCGVGPDPSELSSVSDEELETMVKEHTEKMEALEADYKNQLAQ